MPQIRRVVIALLVLTLVGTLGFAGIEGWSLFDGLYMSVITLTTVGYGEVHPLSTGGRVFAMAYLLIGLGVFMFGIVMLGERIVRAELGNWLGKRKMQALIESMRDHFIVCGCGRFGRRLCEELAARGMRFVVVENGVEGLDTCRAMGWVFVEGDATEDSVLVEAGIDRATGIACTLPGDAANLYVVMTARLARKDLRILSRATTDRDAEKLRRAGADKVISVYTAGAVKMAQLLANPHVENFFEVISGKGKSIDLAEVEVVASAPYAGKSLQTSGLRERGIIVVGLRRGADLQVPPEPSNVLATGDFLLVVGKMQTIQDLLRGTLLAEGVRGDGASR